MKIENINQFLDEIKKLESKNGNSLFYRGHSDKTYDLEPSIYRKDKKTNKLLYIENEDKIYRETIAKVPYDFNGKNTIESLVLMQHYGVPTRILDLTTNPLVALYFACVGNENEDGEVIVFDIPEESICYFDSDRVTILANLAKCKNSFYYYKDDVYCRCKSYLGELEKKFPYISYSIDSKEYRKLKNYVTQKIDSYIKEDKLFFLLPTKTIVNKFTNEKHTFLKDEEDKSFLLFIQELKRKVKSVLWKKRLSINKDFFGELLHFIKEDRSYFQNIIDPDDIGSVFAIKPKLNNPRIVRQHGAFLIFGIKESPPFFGKRTEFTKEMVKIPSQWIERGDSSENSIIIEKSNKDSILKELDKLGINKSTLFPEIDKVADYIKEKYTQK